MLRVDTYTRMSRAGGVAHFTTTVYMRTQMQTSHSQHHSSPTYQRRLPSTLHPIQAQEERRGRLSSALILFAMQPQAVENERNTVLRLVINNVGHVSEKREITTEVAHVCWEDACGGRRLACDKAAGGSLYCLMIMPIGTPRRDQGVEDGVI